MIRRPPRSTLDRSSAASDVYKRQVVAVARVGDLHAPQHLANDHLDVLVVDLHALQAAVSYTHLRAHETVLDLVCRLLLEQKKTSPHANQTSSSDPTLSYALAQSYSSASVVTV